MKDPHEYPTLVLIYELWKQKKTIHQITKELNERGILSRTRRTWSWAAVQNIIKRFENGLLKLD